MDTEPREMRLSAAWPWLAWTIGAASVIGHLLLAFGGRYDGLLLIASVTAAVFIALAVGERRNREYTKAIVLARDRVRGLARAHEEAVRNEQRFRALVLNAAETIAILDRQHTIRYASPSVARLWGYASAQLVGDDFFELVHPQDANRVRAFLRDLLRADGGHRRIEYRLRHEDGSWRHLESVASNLLATRHVGGIVLNSRDITDRKELEERLHHEAFHDPLTGLPNRALFMNRLQQALSDALVVERNVAVLIADIDRFKAINDSFGHAVGDDALVAVGRVLALSARERFTVARLGGDEFALLLRGVSTLEAVAAGERLIAAIRGPLRIHGHDVQITLSVGVADSLAGPATASDLLRAADLALYEAKRGGRNRCEAFNASLDSRWRDRLALESALQGATERGELENHYQPIVDIATGAIVGMEALVRWRHPQRGLVSPGEFVPLAEESGEIVPMGRWVLNEACRQARMWAGQHPGRRMRISVNVSVRQLQHPGFAADVSAALAASGLDPTLLQLEITESLFVEHGELAAERLRELKQLGVRLAVDDFGTGYSALSYLAQLPLDTLKLDRSFTAQLGSDRRADSVVRAIAQLADGLDVELIAEGIETDAQRAVLHAFGYSLAQGFLFARPAPAAELADVVGAGFVDAVVARRAVA